MYIISNRPHSYSSPDFDWLIDLFVIDLIHFVVYVKDFDNVVYHLNSSSLAKDYDPLFSSLPSAD